MIAIPALDLRGGACVQLAAGSYDEEVIRIPDPIGVAVAWRRYGFCHLHVVDLDGVARRGNNGPEIQAILGATDVEVQVGGGIRSSEAIRQSLSDGAQRVVIGTRALEDPDWCAVRVMVRRSDVINIMEQLESLGASAILETQITNCRL